MANFTNPTNVTSMIGFAEYLNTSTTGYFWAVMLITFFLILFLGFSTLFPREDALTGSAFVGLMMALVLRASDLLPNESVLLLFGVLLMLGMSMQWRSRTV